MMIVCKTTEQAIIAAATAVAAGGIPTIDGLVVRVDCALAVYARLWLSIRAAQLAKLAPGEGEH